MTSPLSPEIPQQPSSACLQSFLAWTCSPGVPQIPTWGNLSFPGVVSPPHHSGSGSAQKVLEQLPTVTAHSKPPSKTPAAPWAVRVHCLCYFQVSSPFAGKGCPRPPGWECNELLSPWTDEDLGKHLGLNSVVLFLFRKASVPWRSLHTLNVRAGQVSHPTANVCPVWHQAQCEFWSIKSLISTPWKI